MTKPLPRKPFYALSELCDRWSLNDGDIASYVLEGELKLSFPVGSLYVEASEDDEDTDGNWFSIPLGKRWIVGTVELGRVDGWSIITDGRRTISRFYTATGETLNVLESEGQERNRLVERSSLVIRRTEMERFEDEQGLVVATTSPDVAVRDRPRGAPPKYDWEGFWVELVRHLWDEGCPKTQSELLQVMRSWFEKQLGPDHLPSDSSIKSRLSQIWPSVKPDLARPSALSLVKETTVGRHPEKVRASGR